MRILLVNKFLYRKGGSESYLFELADMLKKNGHEVRFYGMKDERNIVDESPANMVENVEFHGKSLKQIFYPFKIIYSFEAKKKIRNIIEEFNPDIVHLNNYNYQITPSILYEIKKHNIPIVQTIHDFMLICPSHSLYNLHKHIICEQCNNHAFYKCIRNRCMFNSLPRSVIGAFEAYFYHMLNTYKLVSYFICPSEFLTRKLVQFGFDDKKLVVLHNFVDTARADNQKKDYVLYFGRITQEKGINTLVKAAGELPDIKFIMAGTGDRQLEEELAGYTNIEYVGFKSGEELKKLISESLFTICPSECYENCPLSVLESQALSTPVIGAGIGGIPELIEEGAGLLFESGDHEDLADKISYLYNNRDVLSQFSAKCAKNMDKYSKECYYQSIIKIYNDAIRGIKCPEENYLDR